MSFNQHSLEKIRRQWPNITTGYLCLYPSSQQAIMNSHYVNTYWLSVILDPTLIFRMHQQQRPVWVWTVDNPYLLRLLLWLGVDGITTNRPDRLNQLLDVQR